MLEKPRFMQGVFAFEGQGMENPLLLNAAARLTISPDRRGQLIYVRAGNTTGELVYLELRSMGKTMRLFPIGAKSAVHVPLAVVEDLQPETLLEVFVAAPSGLQGSIVLDIGLVEI